MAEISLSLSPVERWMFNLSQVNGEELFVFA